MSEFDDNLRRQVISDEGFLIFPALPEWLHIAYYDSKHKPTVGYGCHLGDATARKALAKVTDKTAADLIARKAMLTEAEAQALLGIQIATAVKEASSVVKNFDKLSGPRKLVVVSMIFQMGMPSVKGFKNMIAALNAAAISDKKEDWAKVVFEMEHSKWFNDTPNRAKLMMKAMTDNAYPRTALPLEKPVPPKPSELPGPSVPLAHPTDGPQGHNNPHIDFPRADPPKVDPPRAVEPRPAEPQKTDPKRDDPTKPIPLGPMG